MGPRTRTTIVTPSQISQLDSRLLESMSDRTWIREIVCQVKILGASGIRVGLWVHDQVCGGLVHHPGCDEGGDSLPLAFSLMDLTARVRPPRATPEVWQACSRRLCAATPPDSHPRSLIPEGWQPAGRKTRCDLSLRGASNGPGNRHGFRCWRTGHQEGMEPELEALSPATTRPRILQHAREELPTTWPP